MSSSISCESLIAAVPAASTVPGAAGLAPRVESRLRALQHWFQTDFSLIDGRTGELLRVAGDHSGMDWSTRTELAREVSRRQRAEFIEEEDPWALLALPIGDQRNESLIAVGVFLTRAPAGEGDFNRLAALLGCRRAKALEWAGRQTPVAAEVLARMAELVASKWDADQNVEQLEEEVEKLSVHLGST
ncbi:MAG TPA: hypothetical protein VHB99_02010, partial [Pirellulales bacterium]|nr:hypothetical protein [Pirellulales bacterium]